MKWKTVLAGTTALAIAGRGEAKPASLIAAIAMAGDMAARRRAHDGS